jgi:two-component system, NarL family, sensor kinase
MEKWQDPKIIAIWIVIILLLIFFLVIAMIKLVYILVNRMVQARLKESQLKMSHQQDLLESNLLTQEKERRRIAADLHDSLIGKLTVLRLTNQMDGAQDKMDALIGESIDEARKISHDLSPPMMEQTPLEDILSDLIEARKNDLPIRFVQDIRSEAPLTVNVKTQLSRILHELITNIHKHAHASAVCVHLRYTPALLAILVVDNGKGFDMEQGKHGLGLMNIELRMQYLSGKYRIVSRPGKGTRSLFFIHHPPINDDSV